MMLRRLFIAGVLLDIIAAAAAAKLVTVGPGTCPVAANAEPYAPPADTVAEDATPRLKVQDSVVVLHDVRLQSSQGGLLFARVALDPETGGFLGEATPPRDCDPK